MTELAIEQNRARAGRIARCWSLSRRAVTDNVAVMVVVVRTTTDDYLPTNVLQVLIQSAVDRLAPLILLR
jgi:hypothetical protein